MLGMIDSGLSGPRVGAARIREMQWSLAWLAATITAAAAAGATVGRGEFKFAALPVVGLAAAAFARVPAAGYIAILWSVGTAVDMLALPEVGVSSLQFVPAEVLLWIALGSLLFLRGDVRRALSSLAMRRESVVVAIFLAAVVGGVAVGVENGASFHEATFGMRYMLFYAAFWPALAALTKGRWRTLFTVVSAGVVVVVILQVPPGDGGAHEAPVPDRLLGSRLITHVGHCRVLAGAPTWTHDGLHRRRFCPRPRSLGAASR